MRISIPAGPARIREVTAFSVGLAGYISLIMLLSRTGSRLVHPLWLDECITALLAGDRSLSHMLGAIRGGVENNPPTFYLFLWPTAALLGGVGTLGLRLFAGAWMLAGITGVYAICQR